MDLKEQGIWNQFRGRVREAWGVLTEDDLDRTEGKWDRIVGTIQEKTGEGIDSIEDRLSQLLESFRQPQD
jgi:uncharacterized protein YjbJ (UPF0337 family)